MSKFDIFRGRGRAMLNSPARGNPGVLNSSQQNDMSTVGRQLGLGVRFRLQGGQTTASLESEDCDFCQRPRKQICCQACGHMFPGRVRVQCIRHPEVIHLMDCTTCPECKARSVIEVPTKQI